MLVALVLHLAYNTILTTHNTITHMSKRKSTRRPAKMYTLKDKNLNDVQIDLNNYKTTCTVTHERKSFYHKYLNDLIQRDYAGNIDTFRTTYISRAARARMSQAERLNKQIERARARLDQLLQKQATL